MSASPRPGAFAPLVRRDDHGVTTLTLSSPHNRNALSEAMLAALAGELASIARDPSVRAVILAAEGAVFSAGHDLKELTARRADADGGKAYFTEIFRRCSAVMTAIVRLPQPVIARVQGLATAAGCQLVASSDLAIAGRSARFCTPGVSIGLFCSTPMVALSRNVAPKHAMEMLLTGEPIDATGAQAIGLVNRVVPDGDLADETEAVARVIAGRSRHTIALGKRTFQAQREMTLDEAYAQASAVMVENMLAADAREGIDAFLNRRPPHWSDA